MYYSPLPNPPLRERGQQSQRYLSFVLPHRYLFMKRLTTLILILLAIGVGTATAAPSWPGSLQKVARQSSGISLEEAAEQVRQQTGGRILSAKTVKKNGRRVHRIKVLTPNHRVVIREIDAGG